MYLPWLENETIDDKANGLLNRLGRDDEIPIDIEMIIEDDLNIEIIPVTNMQQDLDIEGFTLANWSSIYIDEHVYTNCENRARATLAHEVGHFELHKDILNQAASDHGVHDKYSWMDFYNSMKDNIRQRFEYQGYTFAGMILVPTRYLTSLFLEVLPSTQDQISDAKAAKLRRKDYLDPVIENIAIKLVPQFEVSMSLLKRRIYNSGLEELIK
ncbi:MAG: ImmA/IrrE family metallo-endopeptidase [Candidatus Aegiribacteria sp.]|nr:ImmA/IrrE family metallo-endopeptidase [Candidatus Aegiribacteria sp.]